MKITKHGSTYKKEDNKKEKFECGNCGCKFDCDDDEFYTDYGGGSYLVCSCPECHKICKKTRERQSSWSTANTVPYTYTNVTGTATPNTVTTHEINMDNLTFTCADSTH